MSDEISGYFNEFLKYFIPLGLPILFLWLCIWEWKRGYPSPNQSPEERAKIAKQQAEQRERSNKRFEFFLCAWWVLGGLILLFSITVILVGWFQETFLTASAQLPPTPTPTPQHANSHDWDTVLLALFMAGVVTVPVIQFGFWVERFLRRHRPAWVGHHPAPTLPDPLPPRCILRPKSPPPRILGTPRTPIPIRSPSLSEQKV